MKRTTLLWLSLFVAIHALAMAVGVSGDFLLGMTQPNPGEIAGALILSPLTILFGSKHIPVGSLRPLAGYFGLLFWPLWVITTICFFRYRNPIYAALLFGITAAGYWCIVHKFWAIMSI